MEGPQWVEGGRSTSEPLFVGISRNRDAIASLEHLPHCLLPLQRQIILWPALSYEHSVRKMVGRNNPTLGQNVVSDGAADTPLPAQIAQQKLKVIEERLGVPLA